MTHKIVPPLMEHAVAIDTLVLDPDNARIHDEANLQSIRDSLDEFGQHRPAVVQSSGRIVRVGNGMVQAAKDLGWTEIAAIFLDEDEAIALARAVVDNRTSELSRFDDEILLKHLDHLKEFYELPSLGFSHEDYEALKFHAEPDFQPGTIGEQSNLDEKKNVKCPECGHEFTP